MPRRRHIHIIEYLRGLAALSVAWFHLINTYEANWVRATGAYGWLGVEVFFVISGFVIPYGLASAMPPYTIRDFPRFMVRRITRIELPYLASIALALMLWQISALVPGFRGGPPRYDLIEIGAHFLYLIPFTGRQWLQPVYWTLAWEFGFYITTGLLFSGIGIRRSEPLLAGLLIIVSVGAYFEVFSSLICLFVTGVATMKLLEACYRHADEPAPANRITIALFGATMVVIALIMALLNPLIAAVAVATSLLILLFSSINLAGPAGRILSWLGTISFSLYLVHIPIGGRLVNIGSRFVDAPWQQFLVSLIALFCSLAFAAVFHAIIERPALNWSRRIRFQAPGVAKPQTGQPATDRSFSTTDETVGKIGSPRQ